jgi:hypothetical protein
MTKTPTVIRPTALTRPMKLWQRIAQSIVGAIVRPKP